MISPESFVKAAGGRFFIGEPLTATGDRKYRSLFGVTPFVTDCIWNFLIPSLDGSALPVHLLWTLYFLKFYDTEQVSSYL